MDQDPLWKYDYRTRTLWESEVEKARKQAARPGWINQSDGTVRCGCVVSPLPPGEYTARIVNGRGGIRGSHADLVIVDDPMMGSEALNSARRKVVADWYENTILMRRCKKGRFETFAAEFDSGKVVRRLGWKNTMSGIVKLPNTRFVTLLLPDGRSKHWEPYAEDFAADDWYIV